MAGFRKYALLLVVFSPAIIGLGSLVMRLAGPDAVIATYHEQITQLESQQERYRSGDGQMSEVEARAVERLEETIEVYRRAIVEREVRNVGWLVLVATMVLVVGLLLAITGRSRGAPTESTPVEVRDPASDPVASRTSWSPLKGGGASFVTHRLVDRGERGLLLRSSSGFRLFGLAFGLPGLVLGVVEFIPGFLLGDVVDFGSFLQLAASVNPTPFIFVIVSLGILFLMTSVTRVDRRARAVRIDGQAISFGDVAGLQVVSELVASRHGGTFTSHELNLVLRDASRRNLMDHADLNRVLHDGKVIADAIGVPLWGR